MKAVIFDIDNTILYHTNRNPFNWSDLSGDKVIKGMKELIKYLDLENIMIILITGRPESVRPQTEEWLDNNNIQYDILYMKDGDPYGKAYLFKEKILKNIQNDYNILMVFEDDTKCAEMYINNGILVLSPLNYQVGRNK